jgi:drug/metabolite transporter (DMT)-like permease
MHLTQSRSAAYEVPVVSAQPPRSTQRQETAGFLVSVVFVCLAAVRDVYLGSLFQRITPLLIAVVAFSLCTVLFLPALVRSHESLSAIGRHLGDLFWVNITTAAAWLAFLYALKLIEPSIVQILYSGIGPLSVIWIERNLFAAGGEVSLTRAERLNYLALLATLAFSAGIVMAGLSGTAGTSVADAALGIILAAGGGILISVSTMVCRKLNDAGVTPTALLSLRFPATAVSAAAVLSFSPPSLPGGLAWIDAVMVLALLFIIVPSYVNLVAISLASPLTVRVVLGVGPVLIFFCQMIEGRLVASPYSLVAAALYGVTAVSAAIARQRAIRMIKSVPST